MAAAPKHAIKNSLAGQNVTVGPRDRIDRIAAIVGAPTANAIGQHSYVEVGIPGVQGRLVDAYGHLNAEDQQMINAQLFQMFTNARRLQGREGVFGEDSRAWGERPQPFVGVAEFLGNLFGEDNVDAERACGSNSQSTPDKELFGVRYRSEKGALHVDDEQGNGLKDFG